MHALSINVPGLIIIILYEDLFKINLANRHQSVHIWRHP